MGGVPFLYCGLLETVMMSLGNPVLNQAVQFEASAWLIYVCDLLSINVAIEDPLKPQFVGGYPVPRLPDGNGN
jgi:hypothetical protein